MTTRKPSWLTVPYASSSLTSCLASARKPPISMVTMPGVSSTGRQMPSSAKAGASTATRNTPAFTIAAACR